ncbi:MAG: metallophosphoesterase family protein, partial [Bacteroidales bacterium]
MKKVLAILIAVLLSNLLTGQTNYFEKEPYLFFKNKVNPITGEVTPEIDKVVIQWQLNVFMNDPCELKYGLEPNNGTIVTANYLTDDLWYVELDFDEDLEYDEFYYYQAFVMEDGSSIDERGGSFITPPLETATNLTFYAYGDAQNEITGFPSARHNIACEKINDLIGANPSSQTLLLNVGDWNKYATEESWSANYFNNNQEEVRELVSKMPVMGVYGNHDMWDAEPPVGPMIFEKYWPYSYFVPADPLQAYNRYYSFDYGPMHVSCVHLPGDTWDITTEQLSWLNTDLANTDKKWKIVLLHTPGFSNGGHKLNESVQNDLQPLCIAHGVQLVLGGHQGVYAHWLVHGVHHLTIDGVGRTYSPGNSPKTGIGELVTRKFNHFAELNIEDNFMTITIHYYDGTNWHSDFDTYIQPYAYKICNNEHVTWDQDITYADEIRICSGSTLTITSEVGFVENGKIIVEKGGKLVLDGGLLTSVKEDEFWQGIEVWGDPTLPSDEMYQGAVYILNGGTIENAVLGIRTVKTLQAGDGEELVEYNYAGGIVKSVNGRFINNRAAVRFYKYPATGYSHVNTSFFNGTLFETNEDYFGATNPGPFAYLDNINMVKFNVCEFVNNLGTSN